MTAPNIRQVRLRWTGRGLVFEGGPDGGPSISVDSDCQEGPSPTHLLLTSLAACMGVDVKMILEKSRVPVEDLEVEVVGERAETVPRRFRRIELTYRVKGPTDEDQQKLQRAVDLSREKYCSVLHSLDPGIELDIRVERA